MFLLPFLLLLLRIVTNQVSDRADQHRVLGGGSSDRDIMP